MPYLVAIAVLNRTSRDRASLGAVSAVLPNGLSPWLWGQKGLPMRSARFGIYPGAVVSLFRQLELLIIDYFVTGEHNLGHLHLFQQQSTSTTLSPRSLLSLFCMAHALIWTPKSRSDPAWKKLYTCDRRGFPKPGAVEGTPHLVGHPGPFLAWWGEEPTWS